MSDALVKMLKDLRVGAECQRVMDLYAGIVGDGVTTRKDLANLPIDVKHLVLHSMSLALTLSKAHKEALRANPAHR